MAIFNFWRKPKPTTEARDQSIGSTLNIINLASDFFGLSGKSFIINEQMALSLSAVWSCVRVLSESFATLPVHTYRAGGNGRTQESDHYLTRLLRNPNRNMTSFVFRQMAMAHVVLRGNFYAFIAKNNRMEAIELLPIGQDVEIEEVDGELFYKFELGGDNYYTHSTNILHIKGFTTDGIIGKSVISAHKDTIGLGISAQRASKDFYDNGSKLQGYIQLPGKLDQDTVKKLRDSWGKTYGGLGKSKTAILDNGAEYKTINLTPEDAKYLETRKYQKEEIASIFRVPPHMIGIMDRATWNNVESMGMEFAKYTMLPYCVNWEEEINTKLLKERDKSTDYVKFNLDVLQRADIKTRYESYVHAIQNGIKTINEVRQLEDMNPVANGDQHFIQLNMTTIDKVGGEDA